MTQAMSQLLADYVCDLKYEKLSSAAIQKAKTCFLHALGVALASSEVESVRIAWKASESMFGTVDDEKNQASILGSGLKVPLSRAMFVNSVMFHTRIQEDSHVQAITHFGPIVVPVSLALAESMHRSGKELIEALIAGYQIGGAVGSVTAMPVALQGYRPTSIFGAFGGVAAASKLMGLNEIQTANAVSFAANFAFGLNETWLAGGPMDYTIHTGLAAFNSLMAAVLAREGGESAETALEGQAGFYRVYGGLEDVRSQLEEALAKEYQIFDVVLKPYCVSACCLSPVTAVLNLLSKTPVAPDEISKIQLTMNPGELNYPGVAVAGPFSRYGSTVTSVLYSMATALKNKGVTMAGMLEFDDPVIMDLISKTELLPGEDKNRFCCVLDIETKDGRKLSEDINVSPMYYDFSFEKDAEILREIVPEMKITPEKFDQLVQVVSELEELDDVSSIIGLLVD